MLPEAIDKENAAFDTTAAPFFFAGAEEKLPAAKQFGEQSAERYLCPARGEGWGNCWVQSMRFFCAIFQTVSTKLKI